MRRDTFVEYFEKVHWAPNAEIELECEVDLHILELEPLIYEMQANEVQDFFTGTGVDLAISKLKNYKAPGPNETPNLKLLKKPEIASKKSTPTFKLRFQNVTKPSQQLTALKPDSTTFRIASFNSILN